MTYEENVRKVAEEMAKCEWDESNKRMDSMGFKRVSDSHLALINLYTSSARIAVRLKADGLRQGLVIAGYNITEIKKSLLERGLIPDPVDTIFPGKPTGC